MTIKKVEVINKSLRYPLPSNIKKKLVQSKIKSIIRRGKYGLIILSNRNVIIFHLGMTGKFKIDLSKNQKFIEFSVDSYNLISNLAKKIKNSKSCLLIIDYGATKKKMLNSIQAVYKHNYINVFDKPYLSDISYCPNFYLLKKIVERNYQCLKVSQN